MKKSLIVLLIGVFCSFVVSCTTSVESSSIISSEDISSAPSESNEMSEPSELSEEIKKPVFTKDEALLYFTPRKNDNLEYGVFIDYEIPVIWFNYKEVPAWLNGTSEITHPYPDNEMRSIYDFYSYLNSPYKVEFHIPFSQTTLYCPRINGESTKLTDGTMYFHYTDDRLYYDSEVDVNGNAFYCTVSKPLGEKEESDVMEEDFSFFYNIGKLKNSPGEIRTLKIFDQKTNEYYDVEAICWEKIIKFVFNNQKFLMYADRNSNFKFTDDILNNIVLFDFLEEYNKIK